MQEASVYEAKLMFHYGPDFDKLATSLLIASGLSYISVDFLIICFIRNNCRQRKKTKKTERQRRTERKRER